jgi:nucleotide-binding universal stress UspA family protein
MPDVGPIVVGTDFSETAGVALAEARRLAGLLRTEVVVVHVADGQSMANGGSAAERWLRSAGLEAGVLVVRTGSAWVELARYAAEVAPALVVVGSHGLSGYQPLTIGSTASRVTMHARCPVVVVSPRVGASPLEKAAGEGRGEGRSGRT